jgi:hypothetical protein
MHFHKPATVWLLALATGQFILGRAIGAEATHWGQPVSGMRAGVAIEAGKSGLELIVDFQNVGSRAFSLRIASGAPMAGYDFSTWAVSPEGTSVELYFRPGVSVGGILKVGLPYFLVEQIPPGGTYEITQPVTAIVATGKEPGTGGTPLQTLLRQSYKVGISYRMDPDHRQTKGLLGRYPDLWVGALESGAAGLDDR